MPNIKIDTGVSRRILSYTHKSSFVDDPKDVDESHQIYLKDRLLVDKCKETKLPHVQRVQRDQTTTCPCYPATAIGG